MAYVEDVMVHDRYRKSGLGSMLMARLRTELGPVAVINLFCAAETAPFSAKLGFRPTTNVLMQLKQRERPAEPAIQPRRSRRCSDPSTAS